VPRLPDLAHATFAQPAQQAVTSERDAVAEQRLVHLEQRPPAGDDASADDVFQLA
jgi:hypothetical protein